MQVPHVQPQDDICAVCETEPSSPAGEHVWPRWFLRDSHGKGPFTIDQNGVPITRGGADRDEIRTTDHLEGAKLPMCTTFNGVLSDRFEGPSKGPIRAMRDGPVDLTARETLVVVLWLLKTGLLLNHPRIRWTAPQVAEALQPWDSMPRYLVAWMRTGKLPPADVSLFVNRAGDRVPVAPGEKERVLLRNGGKASSFGIGPIVRASVVYHPGVLVIDHPLVKRGEAQQLWPPSQPTLRTSKLPPVNPSAFAWTTA